VPRQGQPVSGTGLEGGGFGDRGEVLGAGFVVMYMGQQIADSEGMAGLQWLVLVYLLAAWQLTGSRRVLVDAGVFAWPVLLLALTAGLLIIEKSYRIFVKQDHDPRRLRRGMNLLPGLLAGLILLGFSGSWYRALRIIAGSAGDTRPYAAILIDWGIQATALLQVSLSAAVLGALMWFLLADRIGRIEKDEAAALLCE